MGNRRSLIAVGHVALVALVTVAWIGLRGSDRDWASRLGVALILVAVAGTLVWVAQRVFRPRRG